jgi:hypothetical protein
MNCNQTTTIDNISDDDLLMELMDWIRIGRNEDILIGNDKIRFRSVISEINKRKLLNKQELYHDRS